MNMLSTSPIRPFTRMVAIIAPALFLALLSAGCQQPEAKVEDAKEEVVDANQDLREATREMRAQWQEDWLEFKRENDAEFAGNERSIIAFRNEVKAVDFRYRDKYNVMIDALERRNNELRDRVNNYKDAGDAKWEEFKRDFTRDMDDLESSRKAITIKNS